MALTNDSTKKTYLPVPPDKTGNLEQALAMQRLPSLGQHPALAYIRSLSTAESRRTMIHSLNTIAEILDVKPIYTARADRRYTKSKRLVYTNLAWLFVPWHSLRYEDTNIIKAALAERLSVGGANKALSALRRVLKEAWRLGHMSAEDYQAAIDLDNFKGQPQATTRVLTDEEFYALLAECYKDTSAAGVRDAAILAFMWFSGAQRASVVRLEIDHYDPVTGDGTLYGVRHNRNKTFCLAGLGRDLLNDWLLLRGDHPGPVFQPITQTGDILRLDELDNPHTLTPQAIYYMIQKRARGAGMRPVSPHDVYSRSAHASDT
jgi:integrase